MTQELLYTSAPRGLKPGVKGFCTVASTAGMSAPLAERLESLSGYRHLYPPHDKQAQLNPVQYSHLIVKLGGQVLHVLSRVCDAGLDYSQRSNKLAHHVALTEAELAPAGPAWLLSSPGFMETSFAGEPRLLPAGRRPPQGASPPRVCRAWEAASGDAGWAGVLAESAADGAPKIVNVIYPAGAHVLSLVDEAMALLPAARRWAVTFSTYFTKLPPGIDCNWRFLVDGEAEAKTARRTPQIPLIDLCSELGPAEGGPLVSAARTGHVPEPAIAEPAASETAAAGPAVRDRGFRNHESSFTAEAARAAPGSSISPRQPAAPGGRQGPPQLWPTINPSLDGPPRRRDTKRMLVAAGKAFGVVLLVAGAFALGEVRGGRSPDPPSQGLDSTLRRIENAAQFDDPNLKFLDAADGEIKQIIALQSDDQKKIEKLRSRIADARTGLLDESFAGELRKLDKQYQELKKTSGGEGQRNIEAVHGLQNQIGELGKKTQGIKLLLLAELSQKVDELGKRPAAKQVATASAGNGGGGASSANAPGTPDQNVGTPNPVPSVTTGDRGAAAPTTQLAGSANAKVELQEDVDLCGVALADFWGKQKYLTLESPRGTELAPNKLPVPFCSAARLSIPNCDLAKWWDRDLIDVRLEQKVDKQTKRWVVTRDHKKLKQGELGEFSSDGKSLMFLWRSGAEKPFDNLRDCSLKIEVIKGDDRDFSLRGPRVPVAPCPTAIQLDDFDRRPLRLETDIKSGGRPWPARCHLQMEVSCPLHGFQMKGAGGSKVTVSGLELAIGQAEPIELTYLADPNLAVRLEPKFKKLPDGVFQVELECSLLTPSDAGGSEWQPYNKQRRADLGRTMKLAAAAAEIGLSPPRRNLTDTEAEKERLFANELYKAEANGGSFTKSVVALIKALRSSSEAFTASERSDKKTRVDRLRTFCSVFSNAKSKEKVLFEVIISIEDYPG